MVEGPSWAKWSRRKFYTFFGSVSVVFCAYLLNEYFENWWLTQKYDNYVLDKMDHFSKDFSQSMERRIEKVTDDIYVALGYGLANTVFLEAPEGLIVVDTQESTMSAMEVIADYRLISNSTVKAVILTHFHGDHVGGTEAFIENTTAPVPIWSHPDLLRFHLQKNSYAYRGTIRQFGTMLPQQLGCGIGKQLHYTDTTTRGFLEPTHFVTEPDMEVQIAGLTLRLMHIPGESDDQIAVWHPEKNALISADNVYKAFPNLYAIRGSQFRDPLHWVQSIDKMRSLRPHFLVPCHLEPLDGENVIYDVLSDYRDAIQYVHDQAMRHINLGTHPDEAGRLIKLPDRLAQNPYLEEYYGTIAWSVKAVYSGYIGWFHGHPEELNPLAPSERAPRLVKLAGGLEATLAEANRAVADGDAKWALELVSAVLQVDKQNIDAKWLYLRCLVDLAALQKSSNGRNYYMTMAEEALNRLDLRVNELVRRDQVRLLTMRGIVELLGTRMRGEVCKELDLTIAYQFTDTNQTMYLQIRNGIFEYVHYLPDNFVQATIHMEEEMYRSLVVKKATLLRLLKPILSGKWWIEGNLWKAFQFVRCIDMADQK